MIIKILQNDVFIDCDIMSPLLEWRIIFFSTPSGILLSM